MRKNSRKLSLNRETLRLLQEVPLKGVAGGVTSGMCGTTADCTDSCQISCYCASRPLVCG
jgi:hypothetical protein